MVAGRSLRRRVAATVASLIALTVGLVLFGGVLLLNSQLAAVSGFWVDDAELSLFLATDCADAVTRALLADLGSDSRIAGVTCDVEQPGYHLLLEAIQDQGNTLASVSSGRLPPSLRVDVEMPAHTFDLVDTYGDRPGVVAVVRREEALVVPLTLVRRGRGAAIVWAVVQGLAAVLLTANTIGQSIRERATELQVMNLVGADRVQIYLPLLVEAWLIAGTAWVIASLVLAVGGPAAVGALTGLSEPVSVWSRATVSLPLLPVAVLATTVATAIGFRIMARRLELSY